MKRRNLIIATMLSLSVAMLTACGGGEETKETTGKRAEVESSITVADKDTIKEDTATNGTTTESATVVADNETTGEETTTKKQEITTEKLTTIQQETTTKVEETTKQQSSVTEVEIKDPIYFEDFNGESCKVTPDNSDMIGAVQEPTVLYGDGVDGTKALYLDGHYSALLQTDLQYSDSYSFSFWIKANNYWETVPWLQLLRDIEYRDNEFLYEDEYAYIMITSVSSWFGYKANPVVWSTSRVASYEVNPSGMGTDVWPFYVQNTMSAQKGTDLNKNEWYHIVVSVDGTKSDVEAPGTVMGTTYVNGQYFGSGQVAKYVMTENAEVWLSGGGGAVLAGTEGLNAYYDNIAIYDIALSAEQVAYLYETQK